MDMTRREQDSAHGMQPGDPAKAANAISAAVDADSRVRASVLGNDALNTYRRLADGPVPPGGRRLDAMSTDMGFSRTPCFSESEWFNAGADVGARAQIRHHQRLGNLTWSLA
jgi:hypothetical protein